MPILMILILYFLLEEVSMRENFDEAPFLN